MHAAETCWGSNVKHAMHRSVRILAQVVSKRYEEDTILKYDDDDANDG